MAELEVKNKQVLLNNYVEGFLKESDMIVTEASTIKLKVSANAVLLKNLYLSCDPVMRVRMSKPGNHTSSYFTSYAPASPLSGLGVVESGHPEFKEGDLVWGITKWEHYSLIPQPQSLQHKIQHTDVPLSYYTGVLGKFLDAVLLNMRVDGRIAVCGMISQYNLDKPQGVTNEGL